MPTDTAKKQVTKCSQEVERIPLEAFRLPNDGRKWKQSARSRSGLLLRLSVKANPDGTFIGPQGQNFSPSFERLSKHVSRGSYTYLTNDLRDLGLLSWTRKNHYARRVYTIHLPEHSQYSPNQNQGSESELAKAGENQYQDSTESVPRLETETQNHHQDSSKSVSTSVRVPSLPTKERADKDFPTPEPSRKPETVSPSVEIKTNFKGAGKEIQKRPAFAPITQCEKCGRKTSGESFCDDCYDAQCVGART